ncbi:putative ankyrin repeat protein [Acanthamoeba castellanii mimivirus]|uniref:Putative ankyrin repeat protein R791 n=6 Tax=Mimivirus TaxID=315393 RepID=YR791_MIMIV|nr:putative ankyrin repeat protein [Acanthamoeba polyphaga mimivirus]Q5UQ04.1 RecName: Full=Putative ankyrin repeat protein R791 [Acanthamoeba polyphaga mimivirus]AEQ61006.1 ankyrin repeat-containing protein [Acanthamoeba castellanii mamavirus]AHA45037.1 putative ankyrin repeat protein [Hirudovirus strain Sangsue]ALR84439.1 ankyrin repeat-containing protein [Niemeyer virus]AMZ03233.1 putative ankyrin repeat protein [Mimivirus Bombay]EJN40551.1 ankyrin containing protein [Acanthamoeba polyphag
MYLNIPTEIWLCILKMDIDSTINLLFTNKYFFDLFEFAKHNFNVLHEVIKRGYVHILKYVDELENLGPLVFIETMNVHDKLKLACNHDQLPIVKYLVETNSNIETINDDVIITASFYGRTNIVEYFIKKDIDNKTIFEALKNACDNGHLETMILLINNGVDIKAKDNFIIKQAISKGHLNIVKYLVENGATIDIEDDTYIINSAQKGYYKMVEYLVYRGADYRTVDDLPIRCALMGGHLDVVKYLQSLGADIEADNESTIDYVFKHGPNESKEYLERYFYWNSLING